jgi:hypothetical protein
MDEKHQNELDRLKKEWKTVNDMKEQNLLQSHKIEIERLEKLLQQTKEEAMSELERTLLQERITAHNSLNDALSNLEHKLQKERLKALDDQATQYQCEKDHLQNEFNQSSLLLQTELQTFKDRCINCEQQITSIQLMLNDERQERHRREEQFILDRDQLSREHELKIRQEKLSAEREMIKAMERHDFEVKGMKNEQLEQKQIFDERLREAVKEYKILDEKYRNRESRPEDIMRIQQLEQEMILKDELVAKSKEELMYFKREMLNREENYNQKFNRQPNVGVMQVIKPKDADPSLVGKPKPTQMRVINTQGGNMLPGNPMMMNGGNGLVLNSMNNMGNGNISNSTKISKSTK